MLSGSAPLLFSFSHPFRILYFVFFCFLVLSRATCRLYCLIIPLYTGYRYVLPGTSILYWHQVPGTIYCVNININTAVLLPFLVHFVFTSILYHIRVPVLYTRVWSLWYRPGTTYIIRVYQVLLLILLCFLLCERMVDAHTPVY